MEIRCLPDSERRIGQKLSNNPVISNDEKEKGNEKCALGRTLF